MHGNVPKAGTTARYLFLLFLRTSPEIIEFLLGAALTMDELRITCICRTCAMG